METLSKRDIQIIREKSRAFRGSVRIPLEKLQHEDPPLNPRQQDDKNISRLVESFRRDGCYRLEPGNHVPVLISESELPKELSHDNEALPLYNPKKPLTFLHGRHRIEAAREFLTEGEQWWVVDVYCNDLSPTVQDILRDQEPNCAKYYDGDILRQVLLSIKYKDDARKERFLSRLSPSKQNWVKRLLKQPAIFRGSLMALLPFIGLWPAMQIGTFQRLFPLHCPEEQANYLQHVKSTWSLVIGTSDLIRQRLDSHTVILLQGRCPGLSHKDLTFIEEKFREGDLFPLIKDNQVRQRILKQMLSIKYKIPSLHSFFEEMKELKQPARILKELLPGQCTRSLTKEFKSLHNWQNNVRVETSESTSSTRQVNSGEAASWLSYRILWLFALRHSRVMGAKPPWKNPKPSESGYEPYWWTRLLELATSLGYRKIRRQADRETGIAALERCIKGLRPPRYYELSHNLLRQRATSIYVGYIEDIKQYEEWETKPEMASGQNDNLLAAHKDVLFLDDIYSNRGNWKSSIALVRDFFHSFFGTPESDLNQAYPFAEWRPNWMPERVSPEAMPDVEEDHDRPRSPAYLALLESESFGLSQHAETMDSSGAERPDQVFEAAPQPTSVGTILERSAPDDNFSNTNAPPMTSFGANDVDNTPTAHAREADLQRDEMAEDSQDDYISIAHAANLLLHGSETERFTVIMPIGNDKFRVHHTQSYDPAAIVKALKAPVGCCFAVSYGGNGLELEAPVAILEEVKSKRLQVALCAPRIQIGDVIDRLNNWPSNTGESFPDDVQTRMETTAFTP